MHLILHSVPHIETLLEALTLAADLEFHTAQSVHSPPGGGIMPMALGKKTSEELSRYYMQKETIRSLL